MKLLFHYTNVKKHFSRLPGRSTDQTLFFFPFGTTRGGQENRLITAVKKLKLKLISMAESPIAGYICDYPNPSGEKKLRKLHMVPKRRWVYRFHSNREMKIDV